MMTKISANLSVGLYERSERRCKLLRQRGKTISTLGDKGYLSFLEILYLMQTQSLALYSITEAENFVDDVEALLETQGIPVSLQQLLDEDLRSGDLPLFHTFKCLKTFGYHLRRAEPSYSSSSNASSSSVPDYDFLVYKPNALFKKSDPGIPFKYVKVIGEKDLHNGPLLQSILTTKDSSLTYLTLALVQGDQVVFMDLEETELNLDTLVINDI